MKFRKNNDFVKIVIVDIDIYIRKKDWIFI